MAVPKQVRKQIRRGEKAFEALNAPQEEGQAEETPQPSEAAAEPVTETEEAAEEAPLPAGQPEGAEKQEAAPAEPAENTGHTEEVDWGARYRSLQGKYDAEVPYLARQNRELSAQNQQLTGRIDALEQQLLAQAQPAAAEAPAAPNGATPEYGTETDRAEFGGDLMDAMGRVAHTVVGSRLDQLASQLNEVTSKIDKVGTRQEQTEEERAQTARGRMFEYLAEHVPDWEALNKDAAFLEWLGQVDPLAGYRRQDMLDDAFAKNDGRRVTEFFTRFKTENAAVAPSTASPSPDPVPTRQPSVRMEDLAAPRTQAGAGGARDEKRLWKRSEIRAFYDQVSRGEFKNREKDRNALERDIIAAQREGRIIDPPRV